MPFFHMCCAFISKKHLALLVAGCFFFLFTSACLLIPVGRIGLFSIMATRRVVSSTAISLLPSNIELFSNRMFPTWRITFSSVYCPLISGCSLTFGGVSLVLDSVQSLLPSNIGLFSNITPEALFGSEWGLLPSNIGLFSNPVSARAHKQRAPGPFCGAKLFLSILPLFLPVVNLNEHPEKPLFISFRRKMHLFIQFESYELQFLIGFSKVSGTFTVVVR